MLARRANVSTAKIVHDWNLKISSSSLLFSATVQQMNEAPQLASSMTHELGANK